MKKVILLGLLISFLGGLEAAAQGPASKVVLAARRHASLAQKLSSSQIEKILKERVARSYQTHFEELSLDKKFALFVEETPPEKIIHWNKFSAPGGKSPYSDLFFWDLISDEAKQNYFLSANNRAIARLAREIHRMWEHFDSGERLAVFSVPKVTERASTRRLRHTSPAKLNILQEHHHTYRSNFQPKERN